MKSDMPTGDKLRDLRSGRILPLLFRYAWPALVTMTLNQLYNVIDRIYIGQGCGPDAIAGLTLTFPIMGSLAAIGVLIGMGSSAILSIKLGEGDMAGAERALGQCVALKLLFGIVFPPLMYFFGIGPIVDYMAGEGTTAGAVGYANLYLRVLIFFNIFAHLGFGLSATMRAEGSPKQSMYCMMVGCFTNLILDPVFIFRSIPIPGTGLSIPGLGLQVLGAAWATNISMMATCATAVWFYLSGRSVVKLRMARVRIYRDIVLRVFAIGLSPCFMQMMAALFCFSINHAFSRWSGSVEEGTIQICAFGIATSVAFLFHIPSIGIQQGVAPIIGFNWGAKNGRRVLEALDKGVLLTGVFLFIGFLCMEFFAPWLCRAFAKDPSAVAAAAWGLRVSNIFIWTIFVNVAATTYFQSTGKPKMAILLSILRQCLLLIPIVWILPRFMENHILAIWLAMPISDVLTAVATIPPLLLERRRLRAMGEPPVDAA